MRSGLMTSAMIGCRRLLLALALCGPVIAQEEPPERVQDLSYGTVLYEYFQGRHFEALTRLNVAKQEGGIEGHGDHPLLVEGGLMLAYGMTREAKSLFERVLEEQVSPQHRTRAWYYLGKVFYLENDHAAASDALERVDPEVLQEDDSELYREWLYLRGQLALKNNDDAVDAIIEELPPSSLWRAYLEYNRALQSLEQGEFEKASERLSSLADGLNPRIAAEEEPTAQEREELALKDRVLLSLGQLHLQQEQYSRALERLQQIGLQGVFAEEALFNFAVAAAHEDQHGLALSALNRLSERPAVSPWLQQVPYARAYLYEQLGRKQTAMDSYRAASAHYVAQKERLLERRESITEQDIIDALQLKHRPGASLTLGEETVANDAYGRLRVAPERYDLAALLAREPFQLTLRDLHELYKLKRSLGRWDQQLDSFSVMLDTRERQRTQRLAETREALEAQQADQWFDRLDRYRKQVNQALSEEDADFFMSDEQKAFHRQIQSVKENLRILPDDETTAEQRRKAKRIEAYFDWWVADEYGVNRWAAQKQLQALEEELAEFADRRAMLQREMAADVRTEALAGRVGSKREELVALRDQIDDALEQTRQRLLGQVRDELLRQQQQVERFLLASRRAQARLADVLYQGPVNEQDQGGAEQ